MSTTPTSIPLAPLRLESLRHNAANLYDRARLVRALLDSPRAPLNADEVRAHTQLIRDRADSILNLLGGR
jgi:hypothetical protein